MTKVSRLTPSMVGYAYEVLESVAVAGTTSNSTKCYASRRSYQQLTRVTGGRPRLARCHEDLFHPRGDPRDSHPQSVPRTARYIPLHHPGGNPVIIPPRCPRRESRRRILLLPPPLYTSSHGRSSEVSSPPPIPLVSVSVSSYIYPTHAPPSPSLTPV